MRRYDVSQSRLKKALAELEETRVRLAKAEAENETLGGEVVKTKGGLEEVRLKRFSFFSC